ncbi:MAG: hypothetical protein PW786_09355 [Arachidicoccus sp.]|nr:hypothetical protein [Arachidicoccus sp.]
MKKKFLFPVVMCVMAIGTFVMVSCNKRDKLPSPPAPMAMFERTYIDYILPPWTVTGYTIPLQLTQPLTQDVTVSFSVSSPSGAKSGSEYTLSSSTVTFKAGFTVPDMPAVISFNQSEYAAGRTDSMVFAINGQNAGVATLAQSQTLQMNVGFGDPIPGTYTSTLNIGNVSTSSGNYGGASGETLTKTVTKIADNTYALNIVSDNALYLLGSGATWDANYGLGGNSSKQTFTMVLNSDNTVTITGSTQYGTIYTTGSAPSTFTPATLTFNLNYGQYATLTGYGLFTLSNIQETLVQQ